MSLFYLLFLSVQSIKHYLFIGGLFLLASCSSKKHITTTPAANIVPGKNTETSALTTFVKDWEGVPYKYGGMDKNGIDCSHLAARLYSDVYKKSLSIPASAMEKATVSVNENDLKEGDLVFFKIESKDVSHVGVYLGNGKFIHASTKKGVMLNDLSEPYYKKYYYKAGRIK